MSSFIDQQPNLSKNTISDFSLIVMLCYVFFFNALLFAQILLSIYVLELTDHSQLT